MDTGNTMTKQTLTQLASWTALAKHADQIKATSLRDLFAQDPSRGESMTAEADGIFLDYSKNRLTTETLKLLMALANETGLQSKIDAMFRGEKINITENRAVLHVALLAPRSEKILVDGADVVPEVHGVLDKMSAFADRVRSG